MSLYSKIHLLQADINPIKKTEENPFFHSQYFDINGLIEAVKPLLEKHKLIIMQPLDNVLGKAAIRTIIADAETGEATESSVPLPETGDAQKMGAAITYVRRYALQSLLLLSAEDDDGETAVGRKPAAKVAPRTKAVVQDAGVQDYSTDPTSDDEFWKSQGVGETETAPAMKQCATCVNHFEVKPGKEWATTCFDCWKKANPIKR